MQGRKKSPSLANTQLSVCTGGTTAVENGIPSSESSFTAPGVRGSLVSRAVEGEYLTTSLYDYAWNPEGSEFATIVMIYRHNEKNTGKQVMLLRWNLSNGNLIEKKVILLSENLSKESLISETWVRKIPQGAIENQRMVGFGDNKIQIVIKYNKFEITLNDYWNYRVNSASADEVSSEDPWFIVRKYWNLSSGEMLRVEEEKTSRKDVLKTIGIDQVVKKLLKEYEESILPRILRSQENYFHFKKACDKALKDEYKGFMISLLKDKMKKKQQRMRERVKKLTESMSDRVSCFFNMVEDHDAACPASVSQGF